MYSYEKYGNLEWAIEGNETMERQRHLTIQASSAPTENTKNDPQVNITTPLSLTPAAEEDYVLN